MNNHDRIMTDSTPMVKSLSLDADAMPPEQMPDDDVHNVSTTLGLPPPLRFLVNTDEPLRPQASPRPSLGSAHSSFSFDVSDETSNIHSVSSEPQNPTRGRSLDNALAHRPMLRRMSTVQRKGSGPIEWSSNLAQFGLLSRGLTLEPQNIFDSIKEPLPPGMERYRSSLSEELYKTATWDASVDTSRFGNHRDTFTIIGLRYLQPRGFALPDAFYERLLCHINFESYLAIRLSCRCWSEAITQVRPIIVAAVCRLPPEILEKIYVLLDPTDFNSARHTCRAWMISSLEENLLTIMLGRGGWLRAAQADLHLQEEFEEQKRSMSIHKEWILSKRLSTECSLLPGWTGNGLGRGLSLYSSPRVVSPTSLTMTSTTDFSELSNGYNLLDDCKHVTALHLTVSACSRFLLITEGCLIYIYCIQDCRSAFHQRGGFLSSLTTIVCPHRVLAVSMDTTSGRFAVAALLEGRVGFICDLANSVAELRKPRSRRALSKSTIDYRGSMGNLSPLSDHFMKEPTNPPDLNSIPNANARALGQAIVEATLPEIHGGRDTRQLWTMDDPFLFPLEASPSDEYKVATDHMPLATGPRSVYRNICSSEDPPRSVAICPQRRCIAFGCGAGIELHWMDALTGQHINRWFPLTVPSDFLYFLPPRPGVDSAKKLRLISSAVHPREVQRLQGRFFPRNDHDATRYQTMLWGEEFHGVGLGNGTWGGSGWCDHYQAIPLSDGWNMLFTDPEQGMLCLGSDAPQEVGVTRLSRKFSFVGPTDVDENAITPSVYASGKDLRWGVRVVVGYGEAIWLFVVASDAYFEKGGAGQSLPESSEADVREPTKVEGIEIGRVPALIDVAVDSSNGDITIWSLAADGMAYVWQLGGDNGLEQQQKVERDGTILPSIDADGDTLMYNTSSSPAVHFDGMIAADQDSPKSRIIDKEVDLNMQDVDEDEGYGSEFETAGGTFAIHAPPLWGRWSENDADWVPDYLARRGDTIGDNGLGIDVLEMSRLDVQVLSG